MLASGQIKTLKIDGRDVSAHENQTILEVARENGIKIPTLCFLEGLSVRGSCRLCLVAIKGSPRLEPACTTRCREGMEVETDNPELHQFRKRILELIFAERNHVCSVCVSNGHCELQALGAAVYILFVVFPAMGRDYQAAVLASGFTGIGLGATPTAIANMTAVTKVHGPAPTAFIILPLVSAFFIDIANAIAIGFMVR